jgi:precorrin-6Y C5,15-methyltransferase (decarboxylating)
VLDIVGVIGGEVFGPSARQALAAADLAIGSARHLESCAVPGGADRLDMAEGLEAAVERAGREDLAGRRVCILASGDPGFFGLTRLMAARLGAARIHVHPAPSSVALAFGRIGLGWDDAAVVSAHGRHPSAAVEAIVGQPKVAVLCSPDSPPQEIGRLVLQAGCGRRLISVLERLGEQDERVWSGDLPALAGGAFDPLAVVIAMAPAHQSATGVGWGRPEDRYAHRAGMITKAEVRAVALGQLALPPTGVMWDIGAGSGSVSAEAAGLAPGLRIFAIEKAVTKDLRANLDGTNVTIVEGVAPGALAGLPAPDRVFVGGGGIHVLEAAMARLRPGGRVVATYASPARASQAWERLGAMSQVSVSRAVPLGDGGLRLAAENPVFVCWGPSA